MLLDQFVATRSEDAFLALVRRHAAAVYSTALRRLNHDTALADDVAQQVFTALATDAARLRRHPSLCGWLYVATRHAAASRMRTERRRAIRETKACAMNEPSEEQPDWRRLRPLLDTALDTLPTADREAVLMRFFGAQSVTSLATALGVSEDAARKRVTRALDRMRMALARHGIVSTAAAIEAALCAEAAVTPPPALVTSLAATAVAGSAVKGASLLLPVMNVAKTLSIGTSALALLALGVAWHESKLAREAAAALDAIKSEQAALQARLADAGAKLRQANDAATAARKETEARRAQPTAPTGTANRLEYVLDHPETHAAYLRRATLGIWARYDRFMGTAALTTAQREQFRLALERMVAADFDILVSLHAQGLGTYAGGSPAPELRQLIQENRRRLGDDLGRILGDEGFRAFAAYSGTLSERNVVDRLAARVYQTESPLTPEQGDKLADLLKQHAFAPADPTRNSLGGISVAPAVIANARRELAKGNAMADWEAPVTDAAIAAAKPVLTPAQVAALERLQAEQLASFQSAPNP